MTKASPGTQHVFDNWPLLAFIHTCLEEGVVSLGDLFERNHYGDFSAADPWYASHHVRHHVRNRLASPEAAALGLDVKPLALSGIEIRHREVTFKILKASDEESPLPPAMTTSRKQFYSLCLFTAGEIYAARNLIIVWDLTSTGEVALQLVAPNGIGNGFEWAEPIPHPATMPFAPKLRVVEAEDEDLLEMEPETDSAQDAEREQNE